MGHEKPSFFQDFLKGRQNRLIPAIPGVSPDITKPTFTNPKTEHISQIVTDKPAEKKISGRQARKLQKQSLREQNPHRLRKLLVRAGLATGVLGLGGYLGNEVYQNVQAQERPVPSGTNADAINNFLNNGEIDNAFQAPSTFDPAADSGTIGPTNAIVVDVELNPEDAAPKGLPEKGVGVLEKGNPAATIALSVFNEDGTVPVIEYEFTRSSISMVDNNMLSITKGIKEGMIVTSPIKGTVYYAVAGRFETNDGLLNRPDFIFDGVDENGSPIHITIMTSSVVNPLIPAANRNHYRSKEETPKIEVDIGDPVFSFTKTIRKHHSDGKSELIYAASGVGEISLNMKDNKVVFVTKDSQPVSQQNP